MKYGITPILSIALVISFLAGAFPFMAGAGDDGSYLPHTRKAGEELIVANGTVILDENEEFKSIKIRKDGHLVIKGVMIQAEELVCRADQTNTSLSILGSRTLAFLRLTKGILDVRADDIVLNGSVITVDNTNTTNDIKSRMVLISRKDLSITNSTITVSAQDGKAGDKQNYGYPGGMASLVIQAIGKKVVIQKSDIKVLGGKGGDNFNLGMKGGVGGDADAKILGDSILVDRCPWSGTAGLRIIGGDVGGSASSDDTNNGNSGLRFEATSDIVIKASDIESAAGTTPRKNDHSVIRAISKKGSLLIDHQKTVEDQYKTLSKFMAISIIVDVPVAADLHEVDIGTTNPAGINAPVKCMWWAFIQVRDVYGQVLENADVKWYQGMDSVAYPRNGTTLLTNETGWVVVEVEGRVGRASSSDKIRYKFEAVIYGGANARSEDTVFEDPETKMGSNRNVRIDITRIDLVIASINSEPFVSGMTVGGVIIFEGTAETRSSTDIEKNVLLDRLGNGDEIEIGKGVNMAIGTAPAFSLWRLTIDTEKYSQGRHTLAMVVSDKFYMVRLEFELIFDSAAVNHKPVIPQIIFTHSLGTNTTTIKNEVEVHVTNDQPVINVLCWGWDRDFASLKLTTGKEIVYAFISIKAQNGEVYFEKTLTDDDFQKKNETGGYTFKFDVDLSNPKGKAGDYTEGLYTMTIVLKDDAGFQSEDSWVNLRVTWDYYPRIDLVIEVDNTPSLDDRQFPEPTWKSLTTVRSDTLEVVFNITGSSDQDSPLFSIGQSWKDLTFKVVIKIDGGQEETAYEGSGAPSFLYSFDVSDIPDGEEGVFSIKVKATDKEGLSSEKLYKARVVHDPPILPNSLIGKIAGSEDTGFDIGPGIFAYIAILVIGILAFVGLMFFNMAKINREKARKIDLIEKLKAEEKKQQKSVVEDEVRSGAPKSVMKIQAPTPTSQLKTPPAPAQRAPVTPAQKAPAAPPAITQPATPARKPLSVRYFKMGGGKEAVLAAYKKVLDKAWADKVLTQDEEAILIKLRKALGISYGEHEGMREKGLEVQTQILDKLVKETPEAQRQKVFNYIKGVAMRDGQITPDEQEMLDELGSVIGLASPGAPGPASFASPPAISEPMAPQSIPTDKKMPAGPIMPPPPPVPPKAG